MELIRFTDMRGVEWEVWEVGLRTPADGGSPATAGAGRWLCFVSATERRRLARYPRQWHAMPPRELDALCRAARPARTTPVAGAHVIARDAGARRSGDQA